MDTIVFPSEIRTAREVLARLSERSVGDGRLRDAIGVVRWDPKPSVFDELCASAGVTEAYLYLWDSKPGQALVAKVAMLNDGEGGGTIVQTGPLEPCMVVDDA